ncbi:hypothetical protein CEP48_00195 [Mergibacter septicus]|uniref:Uncharacterized protein n=1 Tax=Mergibacter septicus TaxID=221402 RepID=A0A8E3S9A3_9PAST|nr:STY4534 family ICE replication protein [Mergibacter septicus]AWX14703.1 hypothetical protein CEP47_00195 [Mergibacter septicus]QDJ13954.1 hypothetical protein CEP48_00195 [Mergibacter septicus]UTU48597.1 DUF3577 domain-containing protein [Mergibacter septicus]WMR95775.1 STY4534 family ICE replication protein [Mergibacter septicus]
MTAQTQQKTYFNLHTTGIGYLSNIREVKPKKGAAFWACDISALSGSSDDVQYTKFSCNVIGKDASSLVRRCIDASERGSKILISFTLSDLWYDTFTYSKGEKAGQVGVMLKARLINIKMIKIDGKVVYKSQSTQEVNTQSTQTVDTQTVVTKNESEEPKYSDSF